jgi:hypothetical protein
MLVDVKRIKAKEKARQLIISAEKRSLVMGRNNILRYEHKMSENCGLGILGWCQLYLVIILMIFRLGGIARSHE